MFVKTLSAEIIHMSKCCSETEVAACELNVIMGVSLCAVGDTDGGCQKFKMVK
jgi:hypothetical protein